MSAEFPTLQEFGALAAKVAGHDARTGNGAALKAPRGRAVYATRIVDRRRDTSAAVPHVPISPSAGPKNS